MRSKTIDRIDIETFSKLFILEDGKPVQLEDWQLDNIIRPIFNTLDEHGRRQYNLALIGLPKKNGKSTLASLIAAYMLLASGEPEPEVYSAAGSQAQAGIIHRQVSRAIQRSPILAAECKINVDNIVRKDGRGFYKVLSSEAPQQHGLNPSAVIFDEAWNQPNYDLYEALTTSPARREPLTVIITYAGYKPWSGQLLWDLYCRGLDGSDPRMFFYWSNENQASWVTQEYLDQQRSRLPEHIFRRLHLNEWSTGGGAFLTKTDVDAALSDNRSPVFRGESERSYHLALDLGLRRDRTAITIVHREDGQIILDHLKIFQASKGSEINISDVEAYILRLSQDFHLSKILFDPWQSINLRQRLTSRGLNIEEFTFSGSNWERLTQNLLGLFKDRRIKIFNHVELVKELLSVQIIERSYGYRIDHSSGAHDDCVVSLGMASLSAIQGISCNVPLMLFPSQMAHETGEASDMIHDLHKQGVNVSAICEARSWPWD